MKELQVEAWFEGFATRVAAAVAGGRWDAGASSAAVVFSIKGFHTIFALDASQDPPCVVRNPAWINSLADSGIRVAKLTFASSNVFLGIVNKRRSLQRSWIFGEASITGDKAVLKDLASLLKFVAQDESYNSNDTLSSTATASVDVFTAPGETEDDSFLELPIPSFLVEFLPASAASRGKDDVVRYRIRCSVDLRGDGEHIQNSEEEPHSANIYVWDVYKRFSDFSSLDSALRSELSTGLFGTPGRRGHVPGLPKMPPKGHIFQNQSSLSFIAKRHEDLCMYIRQLLLMLCEVATGEAMLSPAVCKFFDVPEHIWKIVQQRYFRRRQSIQSNSSTRSSQKRSISRGRAPSVSRSEFNITNSPSLGTSENESFKTGIDDMQRQPITPAPSDRRSLFSQNQTSPPRSSVDSQAESATSMKFLSTELSRQAETIRLLEDAEDNRILGHVRMLENFASMSTTALLTTSSMLILGVTVKRMSVLVLGSMLSWQKPTASTRRTWNSMGLFVAGIFTGLGWWLKRKFENACVKSNAWKRRACILYGTAVVLGGYKLTRGYSKFSRLDARESKLLYAYTHKVLAKFAHRCLDRWAGFWIKAGQYMSARADVVPPAYVKELSQLQDGTVPQPFRYVRAVVEAALRERAPPNTENVVLEDVFSHFEEESLASASIAQVHRATLRGANGNPDQDVVVKVQHPGIEELMRLDMAALLQICRLVAWSEPEFDFEPLMSEWTKAAVKELDFVHEATNLMSVAEGLADQKHAPPRICTMVRVPRVLPAFTTRKVLVIEFSPGKSVGSSVVNRSLNNAEKTELLELITEATAHQIFHIGVFNGDPHPGNILVELPNIDDEVCQEQGQENGPVQGARPVLLDFGLSKHLSKELRLSFCKMIVSASERDLVGLVEAFEEMGWTFAENSSDLFSETMDLMRFFFRDTAPRKEARKQLFAFDRAIKEKTKARRAMKVRRPVKAFPGDILFFIRALELLRGLCSKLEARLSPLKIMADSARTAIVGALLDASLASFVDSARNPGEGTCSIPLSIPERYYPQKGDVDVSSGARLLHSRLQRKIKDIVDRLRADGTLLGCQVAVVVKGKIVVNVCAGPLSPIEGDPRDVQADTLFSSFSCTKAIAATALHMLVAEGKANYTDAVSQHWPAFGCHGKENITIADVLSHRAGLSNALPSEFSLHTLCDSSEMANYLAGCTPEKNFDDGAARYHYLTFGWLVGKLVEILSGGIPIGEFVRQRIALPLGLHNEMVIGVPEEWLLPSWDSRHTKYTRMHANRLAVLDKMFALDGTDGEDGSDEIEAIIERAKQRAKALNEGRKEKQGKEQNDAAVLDSGDSPFQGKEWSLDPRMWNAKRVRRACIPAANGHFSARSLALFYSALMRPIAGTRLLADGCESNGNGDAGELLPAGILRQALEIAVPLQNEGGKFGLGYRRHEYKCISEITGEEEINLGFGHAGAGGSIGLCVPHGDVSFAFTTSRLSLDAAPARRIFSIVCEELGLGHCEELTRVGQTGDNAISNIA